ncbi:MAG: methenyltetrahydromethanopterin cyclohydrolase [Candidatus Lokiarchaeota archaeon]|nr:methenyltetrahydromethanopterin cyclohydrolase [Candidatus Lokiarchaeota archaeon]
MISVNKGAYKVISEIIEDKERLQVDVIKVGDSTVIDMGVKAKGGYEAGLKMSQACLGGYASVAFDSINFGDIIMPALTVSTNQPSIACLGSQFAGWRINRKQEKFFGMGSGPARSLAIKEKELFELICYEDISNIAVIILETNKIPNEQVLSYIANSCGIDPKNTYALVAKTSSIAGTVQIAARIVETGIHKIHELGYDPKKILYGYGTTPIAPIGKDDTKSMGMTNDAIIACGSVFLNIKSSEDDNIERLIEKVPSSTSKDYGTPFYQIFKEANWDFYEIDPHLFAPAVITINDLRTGKTYQRGKLDFELLKRSFGIK